MSNQPLVSVVMTVFKRTEYLEEAIQSVLNQTYKDFELIVTDDANTVAASTICQRFASDTRVRYRSNPNILGAPLNVAAAMRETQGEFVTIINDDDLMEPTMLEKLLPPLQSDPKCVLSFGDHWLMDASGAILPEATEKHSRCGGRSNCPEGFVADPFAGALRGMIPLVLGTIFRRAVYQENWLIPDVAGAYDYWLALRFSLAGGNLYFANERVMRWRTHGNSESARLDPEKARCGVYMFQMLLAENIPPGKRAIVKMKASQSFFILGRDRFYFGQKASARQAFWSSCKYQPNFKSLAGIALTCLPKKIGEIVLRRWKHGWEISQRLTA